jgi:predicted transcriptional regulator of viral defense system
MDNFFLDNILEIVHNLYYIPNNMTKAKIAKLIKLPFFSKNVLRALAKESDNTLNISVKRMTDRGSLIQLKNGYYVTKEYFEKKGQLVEYREFLTCVLCQPAYLSLEYVLGKYEILTEGVKAFTGVTLKSTREYENALGSFEYRTITKRLFTGYEVIAYGDSSYYMATKAKALFDYLYLLADREDFSQKGYDPVVEKRLRVELLTKKDWSEFKRYIKINQTKKTKMIKLKLDHYASD